MKRDEGSASTPQRKTTSGRQQDLVTRLAGFARSGSQIALNVDRESADLDEAMEDEDVSDDDVGPMPMPEDSNGANIRKKRKGWEYLTPKYLLTLTLQCYLMKSCFWSIYQVLTDIRRVSCIEM